MPTLPTLYGHSLSLLTDLYQLTMAYGYWKLGRADHQACFHLHYRKNPFGGGFAVAAGLAYVVDYINSIRFDESDLAYLESLRGNDDKPLFERAFLDYLAAMRFTLDIDAVPEGTLVFPHEPLLRVTGSILQAQILETPLLNMINFQTLIATKAARMCLPTRGSCLSIPRPSRSRPTPPPCPTTASSSSTRTTRSKAPAAPLRSARNSAPKATR